LDGVAATAAALLGGGKGSSAHDATTSRDAEIRVTRALENEGLTIEQL
jgi:hypothetical protein